MKITRWVFVLACLVGLLGHGAAQAQERRGWSPQAKGAVIGGLGGAAAGAIINKRNRAAGGVVGGVAGGALGYVIGKNRDNKNKAAARLAAANAASARREAALRAELARSRKANAERREGEAPLPAAEATAFAPGAAMPAVVATPSGTYLVNKAPADASAPYASSEYRRRSW